MTRLLGVCGLVAALGLVGAGRADDEQPEPKQPARKAGPDLEALFKKLDTNGDGKVSLDEFKKLPEVYPAARRLGGAGLDPDRLKKILERFGGNLDPENLKKILERFKGRKGNFDLEQLKKLLERFKGGDFDPEALKKAIEELKKK